MAFKKSGLNYLIKKLISEISRDIPISAAYVFGSYAKGTAGKWSDIDLALVSPRFMGIRFFDNKRLFPYLRGYPKNIETHPFKKKDFNPIDNLFVKEIIEKGRKIA